MNKEETTALLESLAQIGIAVAAGSANPSAGVFALQAVIREAPKLFGIATLVLSKGAVSDADLEQAHKMSLELLNPSQIKA